MNFFSRFKRNKQDDKKDDKKDKEKKDDKKKPSESPQNNKNTTTCAKIPQMKPVDNANKLSKEDKDLISRVVHSFNDGAAEVYSVHTWIFFTATR